MQVSDDINEPSKSLEYHPVQAFPFSFISALKQKLEPTDDSEMNKKTQESNLQPKVDCHPYGTSFAPSYKNDSSHSTRADIDFITPLKIPDLKISSKMDYLCRESSLPKETTMNLSVSSTDSKQEKLDQFKSFEKVQRRLEYDFPKSGTGCGSVEPLHVPNSCISSTLSKKKDITWNRSKEKESRSKKMKKDDLTFPINNEARTKSPRLVAQKDCFSPVIRNGLEHSYVSPKESDSVSTKGKTRPFTTSTAKKDNERKHKTFRSQYNEFTKENISEIRNRNHESITQRSIQISDKYLHENQTDFQPTKACNNLKLKLQSEESGRKIHDKIKIPGSSLESKYFPISSEVTKTLDENSRTEPDLQDSAIFCQHSKKLTPNDITNSVKIEESFYHSNSDSNTIVSNSSVTPGITGSNSKTVTTSSSTVTPTAFTSTTITTNNSKYTTLNEDSENFDVDAFHEKLLSSRRITFRDSNPNSQKEFRDLTTPDANLTIKSKRKKSVPIGAKQTPVKYIEQEGVTLLHPTALHMQFQAELNLLDSFNESLRQVMDVEKSLNDVKKNEDKNTSVVDVSKSDIHTKRSKKIDLEVAEVQTQTANDIATQTDVIGTNRNGSSKMYEIVHGLSLPQFSVNPSNHLVEDLEDISLPNKIRTMSEISLHETTSSIKTETGTEISISTRDVTCSFNKYLDSEIAQLIKDEKQRYDKIEMLFKSREKTLNDRTKKLVKLEEQKRVLRDTGQESRVSSVKKKQRALLLKLQQEKDEMTRLKELHKIASQERKLMLQKQRNMFNLQMSTKNIITKLKKSADNQSPRRLSGPMKGYDIRSNSSMSSLLDSDKSQHDRSLIDKTTTLPELDLSLSENAKSNSGEESYKPDRSLTNSKTQKYEEKMPRVDYLRLKSRQIDVESNSKYFKSESDIVIERQSVSSEDKDEKSEDQTSYKKIDKKSRKNSKYHKSKSLSSVLTENILRSKSEELLKHHNKRTKVDKVSHESDVFDLNENQNSLCALLRHSKSVKDENSKLLNEISKDINESKENLLNCESTRSRVDSSLAISQHTCSGSNKKTYSKSLVIREHDYDYKTSKQLEQILNAREAAIATRKNCVEEWMAWHARLKTEEHNVAQMEQAVLKLVASTSNVLSHQDGNVCSFMDTTISSDTSDVEGRIEVLTEKLVRRRIEMTRLKREARRQAKHKLKALEANLRNQIKRYDMTIDEMRKQLELTKEGMLKDNDKLAIESKSPADFKVPEIPFKRIGDLLRSKSESDLLLNTNKRGSNAMRNIHRFLCDNKYNKIGMIKSNSECDSSTSVQSVPDELQKYKETTSISGEVLTKKQEEGSIFDTVSVKSVSNEEEPEKIIESNDGMLSFNKKLDFLNLHNKNLNEDINSLENDLKALSEMMSRISQKSEEEKTRSELLLESKEEIQEEKSTSKDVSEVLSVIDDERSHDEEVIQSDNNSECLRSVRDNDFFSPINYDSDYQVKDKEILEEIEKSNISSEIIERDLTSENSNSIVNDLNSNIEQDVITDLMNNQLDSNSQIETNHEQPDRLDTIDKEKVDEDVIETTSICTDKIFDRLENQSEVETKEESESKIIVDDSIIDDEDNEKVDNSMKSQESTNEEHDVESQNSFIEIETEKSLKSTSEVIDNLIENELPFEESSDSSLSSITNDAICALFGEDRYLDKSESIVQNEPEIDDTPKEPEYEDISEESFEVSEILDKNDSESLKKNDDVGKTKNLEIDKIAQISSTKFQLLFGLQKDKNLKTENDPDNSRLNIDELDDDLLNENQNTTSISTSSEKDIKAMIDKLRGSLDQPGIEVPELEAKLLRIEQLEIELEIKKLEAEEVSYYVREIPNKPPPPYTPPGVGQLSTSFSSPSPTPVVIPTNTDELTAFTEKATTIIFNAKQTGKDITNMDTPSEIHENLEEMNESMKTDRRIYNIFLFDLCRETIVEVYRSDYEKPGPSWIKPNVKTKPAIKIPKSVEELQDHVNKEVATLFGFKTKLQRENMVMRWSRKRRDRVDELLAREAQAEEDEWTKFHHDELAVKNELTVAILDTLIMETTKLVKSAYSKKRKLLI